jgi:SAM-dependent methyltransferase
MLSKGVLALATRETFSPARMERKPEASSAVELTETDLEQTEEAATRALMGVYHFCALAVSRIVPENGLVLDLGSGAGAFPLYLAQRRPDITIVGVEPSERLVAMGQNFITDAGLGERMNINVGELTEFSQRIPARIDMITSVLSLHTVATTEDLFKCFQEMSLVRIRCGCGIFMFDFSRPNLVKTAEEFPMTLMPGTPIPFRRNCRNSVMAAFNFSEMGDALGKVSLGIVHHAQSKGLKIYQAHWLDREDGLKSSDSSWKEGRLSATALQQFKDISSMFPTVPLPKHLK